MSRKKTAKTKKTLEDESEALDEPGPSTKKSKTSPTEQNDLIEENSAEPSYLRGNNLIKYHEDLQKGNPIIKYRYSVRRALIEHIKTFKVLKVEAPFDRRVTSIAWHDKNPKLLAAGSKSGDIYLWNYDDPIENAYIIRGIGAGGSIQDLKFDIDTEHRLYSVSVEGKFLLLDFNRNKAQQYLDSMNYKRWFVSLDVNWLTNMMVVGDNNGVLSILRIDGLIINRIRIHKAATRISHVEFSKKNPWLLCTASNDRTIKLWDIRKLKKAFNTLPDTICTMTHNKPFNSAYFSQTDGSRLLATDQYDKILIYRSPSWKLETKISHPHRQFQHLTPIEAQWHPFEDIVVVGRYPHSEFPGFTEKEVRTIDFFDADSGELLYQHAERGFHGISTINKFNCTADALASGSGTRVMIWTPRFDLVAAADLKAERLRAGKGGKTKGGERLKSGKYFYKR